ncbi:MAG: GNAT family N-acetyltransferase [Myxococcales bacterium]|nr:GNAT family N-acetyltransferase [Myxococcales bacterium]
MRKHECHWDRESAEALLAGAEMLHLASSTEQGSPVLRALHAVRVGDLVAFHGAKAGERKLCLGRPAIVSAERILCNIPSYFVDPERACPATTYYESVQASGLLVEVTDLDEKAAVIEALMQKYQPEGHYSPVNAASPLYRKAINGLLVYGIRIEKIHGKFQSGQRREGEELTRILEKLWERGDARDLRTIDRIIATRSDASFPILDGPDGSQLRCRLGDEHESACVALLSDTYWNVGMSNSEIAEAQRSSTAWVGCVDASGTLIGSARALADGSKFAWILDVIVDSSWQSRGVGTALMKLLLSHAKVRRCRGVGLVTRDAHDFYQRCGFQLAGPAPTTGFHQMRLSRG